MNQGLNSLYRGLWGIPYVASQLTSQIRQAKVVFTVAVDNWRFSGDTPVWRISLLTLKPGLKYHLLQENTSLYHLILFPYTDGI